MQEAADNAGRSTFEELLRNTPQVKPHTRYHTVLPILEKDPRFHSIHKPQFRELIFEEYMLKLEEEERVRVGAGAISRDARRVAYVESAYQAREVERRRVALAEFKEVLQNDSTITADSQWRRVKQKYQDHDACKALSALDRLAVFEEVVRAHENAIIDRERIAQQHQRTQQRRNREAFRVRLATVV